MAVVNFSIAWIVSAMVLASAAYAQPQIPQPPPKGVTLKKLPQGMTQQQLQQRLALALARLKSNLQLRIQQSQREAKAIADATANERAAVNGALAKDPRYKAFIEQAQKISAASGTSEAKAQQLRALAKGNQAIFADALRVAKINHSALQGKLRAVVPGITLTQDFAVRKGLIRRGPLTGLVGTSPTTKEFVLKPPFSFEEFDSDNQGIAASDAHANPNADDGKATSRVSVIGVAGGGSADAKFGEFVSVPAGVKRVEFNVTAKTSYNGQALAVLGLSDAFAFVTIEVSNEAAKQFKFDDQYDSAIAIIGWYAEMEGGGSREHKFSFDVPAQGGEYLVFGQASMNAIGAGTPGYAQSYARVEIDKIAVKYLYQ